MEKNIHFSIVKEKSIQTNLKKYGTKFPMQNKEVKQKVVETNIKKYGEIYAFLSKEKKKLISINRKINIYEILKARLLSPFYSFV